MFSCFLHEKVVNYYRVKTEKNLAINNMVIKLPVHIEITKMVIRVILSNLHFTHTVVSNA